MPDNAEQTYQLLFQNNSQNTWTAAVYQRDPDLEVSDVASLAWLTALVAPTTTFTFRWQIDYSFVWSQQGSLEPGVVFTASQTWPTSLTGQNQVTLTNEPPFTFQDQTAVQPGALYIVQDGSIPMDEVSIGIGMQEAGTFAVPAQPNITTTFSPNPTYWITFGDYIAGQVMNIQEITNTSAQIVFPDNVFSMTAVLSEENVWTVSPTAEVNAAFIAAKKTNRNAKWGVL